MRKERIPRLDQEINYIAEKQLKFIYSIMAFSVFMFLQFCFAKLAIIKNVYFLVTIAANVPNLGTSDLRARKKAGRNKLSEESNKGVSNIHNGYNTVKFGQKINEGMS